MYVLTDNALVYCVNFIPISGTVFKATLICMYLQTMPWYTVSISFQSGTVFKATLICMYLQTMPWYTVSISFLYLVLYLKQH